MAGILAWMTAGQGEVDGAKAEGSSSPRKMEKPRRAQHSPARDQYFASFASSALS